MERFVITQLRVPKSDNLIDMNKEIVCSFITHSAANEWINEQNDPTLFYIVDRLMRKGSQW